MPTPDAPATTANTTIVNANSLASTNVQTTHGRRQNDADAASVEFKLRRPHFCHVDHYDGGDDAAKCRARHSSGR